MRRTGDEIVTVLMVLAVPLAIFAVFPYDAVRFRAEMPAKERERPVVAFVTLDQKTETAAERAAKATWRRDGVSRGLHPDLLSSDLPEEPLTPVLSIGARSRPSELPVAVCEPSPFLPSQRAPAPVRIEPEAADEPLTFPREELLKID